jgi:uncharacterized protein DUF4185
MCRNKSLGLHNFIAYLIAIAFIWYIYACGSGGGNGSGVNVEPTQTPPYTSSSVIKSITWDFGNIIRKAPGSDLWPITWAADNNLYTSWGDGGGFGGTDSDGRVSLGFARIEGTPENFIGHNVWGGKNPENPARFGGKALGMISVDGILYAWIFTQNGIEIKLAWSSSLGKTWQLVNDWKFPEDNFVPFSFLNFGKDYAGARDGYVYVYGGPWSGGANQYLARVPKDQIKNRTSYEFFKGLDANSNPIWTSDITQRRPVYTDPDNTGAVQVVFAPGIRRYILTATHGGVEQLGVFDAPEPWGPWTTVAYYSNWGNFGNGESSGYNIPTKWISADGKTIWVVFSSSGELDSFNLLKATLTLKVSTDTNPTATNTLIKYLAMVIK